MYKYLEKKLFIEVLGHSADNIKSIYKFLIKENKLFEKILLGERVPGIDVLRPDNQQELPL